MLPHGQVLVELIDQGVEREPHCLLISAMSDPYRKRDGAALQVCWGNKMTCKFLIGGDCG